jgi:gamma-glutamylcyclotransferase (GGCT)/AIG2-like uncharacterized protein YtfP
MCLRTGKPQSAGELMYLAVNGSLMRGLELNQNLLDAGAVFVREDRTAPFYRLWSIKDRYPGMLRSLEKNASMIALEIWEVSEAGLLHILEHEPSGLTLGRIILENGVQVLGILAEPYLVDGMPEITGYGGWRRYLRTKK